MAILEVIRFHCLGFSVTFMSALCAHCVYPLSYSWPCIVALYNYIHVHCNLAVHQRTTSIGLCGFLKNTKRWQLMATTAAAVCNIRSGIWVRHRLRKHFCFSFFFCIWKKQSTKWNTQRDRIQLDDKTEMSTNISLFSFAAAGWYDTM